MPQPRPTTHHRNAAIVAIGDELVLGETTDTNSPWIARQLAAIGVRVQDHRTLPDDRAAIGSHLAELAGQVDVIVVTGGLGPTADDLTRFALGDVMDPDGQLVVDADATAHLRRWFDDAGRIMPQANHVQTLRPARAAILANPNGTAPGLRAEVDGTDVFCLPGPPHEMKPMLARLIATCLRGDGAVHSQLVHSFGIGESAAAMRLGSLMDRMRNPVVGTTASHSIVTARIRAAGGEQAAALVQRDAAEVDDRWKPWAFGRGEQTLARAVGVMLEQRGQTLAVAESCTGGMLAASVVDIAGSSDWFVGGWVTYSNELKQSCLAVPLDLIERHGAVSAQVAQAMALGALNAANADHAIAITGIAGPTGGSEEKPVGTVFIACVGRDEQTTERVRRFHFTGDRLTVRDRSARSALQMLRFTMLGENETPLLWQVQLDGSALDEATQMRFVMSPMQMSQESS